MTRPFRPPSPSGLAQVHQLAERRLTPEEFRAYVDKPMTSEEREEALALIRWFRRRYPTPLDRLRSARRFMEQSRWRTKR